jgi:hypothetical protein
MTMAERTVEFLVDGWVLGATGQFHVIGCCGDVPIRVNDTFDAIYRLKPRRFPDQLGDDPIRECERPASIRVESIRAYERDLGMLGEGMTGSLVISGEGIDKLSGGWILGMSSDHPSLPRDGCPSRNGGTDGASPIVSGNSDGPLG